MRMNNSTVLITGALTGIGGARALAFAREGARAVFPDPYRNVERLLPPRNQVSRKLSAARDENRKPTRRRARKEPIYADHRV